MSDYGRETITVFELDMPYCQLEYGTTNAFGTCNASLTPVGSPPLATGAAKCFQTCATCQDIANYLPATQVIRFSHPQRELLQYENVFPALSPGEDNPSITPGAINLGGMDRSLSALGAREAVDIDLEDFRWNDHLFDKYRLERISGDASFEQSGTAQAGSVNSLTLAAAASDVVVGRQLRLTGGAGSVQLRTGSAYAAKVASVSPPWRHSRLKWSEDFTNAVWIVGDAANPKIPNSTDIVAPDGTFTACKWVLNSSAVNRSFGVDGASNGAVPLSGRTDTFSFWVYIPASNSLALFPAYMFASGEVPTDYVDLNALPRDQWVLASYTHTWGGSASTAIHPQFHSNTAGTAGDKMYVWKPKLEFGVATAGDYIKTEGAHVVAPDVTTTYEVRDAFNPAERGTFWAKFIARNPYYVSYRARIKQGFMGDALADMRTRHYIVDKISGPKNGKVAIVLKDLFSLIEERKSVAPVASQGELAANITISATSATLNPAGIGALEYPASGYVAVGDEAMAFTRVADALTFMAGSPSVTSRGSLNTPADEHDDDDLVQLFLVYTAQRAHDIIYDLLVTYSGIAASEIDKPAWDIAAAAMTELYTAYIGTPTPVKDLIGELCEQAGCTVWPDPETGMVQFVALRSQSPTVTVNDREWIIENSLDVKRQDAKRVSRVLTYFGQINPLKKLSERNNFRSRVIEIDLDAEGAQQYGVPAIKEIFSRWIQQFGRTTATAVGVRILSLFRNPPLEASFRLHASRDGELLLARPFLLETFEAQDFTGAVDSVQMAPTQIERGANEIAVKAQEQFFFTGDPTTDRIIYINNSVRNVNLREIHDQQYAPPTGVEVVRFIVVAGAVVGSTSTGSSSMRTGTWPTMATKPRLTIEGRVQGKGGAGGAGTNGSGNNGLSGGTALLVEVPFEVDNLDGELWGGGGGGGAGVGNAAAPAFQLYLGGGGGGGGQGDDDSAGGAAGYTFFGSGAWTAAGAGTDGSDNAQGAGGAGGFVNHSGTGLYAGNGGAGGVAGAAGSTGGVQTDTGNLMNDIYGSPWGSPGAGGAAGKYVEGNAFITWINNGDRRGGVS